MTVQAGDFAAGERPGGVYCVLRLQNQVGMFLAIDPRDPFEPKPMRANSLDMWASRSGDRSRLMTRRFIFTSYFFKTLASSEPAGNRPAGAFKHR